MKELTIFGSKPPATRAGQQVANAAPPSGATIIQTDGTKPLHKDLELNLARLLARPAGSAQSGEDRGLMLMNYREAMDGYPMSVADYTLKQLRWHNPRAPFSPGWEDVREHCRKANDMLRDRVIRWFFPEWVPDGLNDGRIKHVRGNPKWGGTVRKAFGDDWGPEPMQPDCYVSNSLVVQWVREYLHHPRNLDDVAGGLSDELKARIPAECWSDELKAEVAEVQRKWAARDEARRAQAEYEANLSPEEREARSDVLQRNYGDSEERIRELTQERLPVVRERFERAREMEQRRLEQLSLTRAERFARLGIKQSAEPVGDGYLTF
jgi:hypothetical protein